MEHSAQHALARFGFGRMPDETLPDDPMHWAAAQLDASDDFPDGPSIADAFAAIEADRTAVPGFGMRGNAREIYQTESNLLVDRALTTQASFRERLVWFWANHFTVSLKRGEITPMVGDYLRNAIRPHVTGKFQSMLMAVMRHPAMLLYLDNAGSVGPGSRAGGRGHRGINENLARECMELHTCTPAAGYLQADVTQFAEILTGWSVERQEAPVGYRFRPNAHQPGGKRMMGHTFAEGEQGGVDALAFLAHHPCTARNLATKLVRHFVADDPPGLAVRRIEAVLLDTGGDLGAAMRAILTLDEAWKPLIKVRTPQDYVFAVLRASGLSAARRPDVKGILANLGQPMMTAPFPIGWPDRAEDWTGPEAFMRRVDWAYSLAGKSELPAPEQLAGTALGDLLPTVTAAEMRRAGSRRDAATILLASPEMHRR